ncbi:MAG: hypothetical protein IMW98_09245 [Firmicutes bacterium]|nr:hypothetical protein [Bacillota bacterium]
MMKTWSQTLRKGVAAAGLAVLLGMPLVGCGSAAGEPGAGGAQASEASEGVPVATIAYTHTKYGFTFTLPASWAGYRIVESQWEGLAIDGPNAGQVVERGPLISIRHPQWTTDHPRQDIPIMVFTTAQWAALQDGRFHIGAAPIGPSELGRNSRYVFALPSRYNYAFPEGWEEVEGILSGHPLQPMEPSR